MAPIKPINDSSKVIASAISKEIQTGSKPLDALIDMIEKAFAAGKISSKQALQLLSVVFKSQKKEGKSRYPRLCALLTALARRPASQSSTSSSQAVPVTGVKPENATNTAVKWSSANPAVVKVDANGKVSGVGAGVTTVTVKADGGYSASCTFVVTQFVHVTGISFGTSTLAVNVGHHVIMDPIITPSNATNKTVKWESSYKGIATIDKDGMITGVSPGKVHITGTTEDGGKTADLILTVK